MILKRAVAWLIISAGVACLVMWMLSIAALVATWAGAGEYVTLAGIARGTIVFTVGIVIALALDRHTSLLTWRCKL